MLPSHLLSILGRVLGLLMLILGIVVASRPQHFPMDWALQCTWFLGGLTIGLFGFIVLIYTPWLSDKEWRQNFGRRR